MGVLFGGATGEAKQSRANIDQTTPQLGSLADTAQYQGKRALKGGIKDINLVGDYYKSLLTGDRDKLTETLSPEIRAVMDQYDSTKRTLSEFGPRGGGTVGGISQLEGAKEGRISDLYAGARAKGAAGLEHIGSTLASLGVDEQKVAVESLGKLLSTFLGEEALGNERGATAAKFGGDLLKGIGELIGAAIA